MRLAGIAYLILSLSASTSVALAQATFQDGDYVVVRGRLAECMTWEHRPLDLRSVSGAEPISLIGLPGVRVLGFSAEEVEAALRRHYQAALPNRDVPPIRVERVRGDAHFREVFGMYLFSLRLQRTRDCPGIPKPESGPIRDDRVPPPLPGVLDELA